MNKRKPIDVEEVKKTFRIRNGNLERLNYNYQNGKWTVVKNCATQSGGYCQVWFNGRLVLYHVIIWILSTGEDIPQGLEIDHINGNKIDSRMENMRLVTKRQNQQNRKKHRAGRLTGACYNKIYHDDKIYHYWKSTIQINKTCIAIGYYKTEQEANEAYKIACEHIEDYKDNKSFRKLINKKMEGK
jgi:hypothetical protein